MSLLGAILTTVLFGATAIAVLLHHRDVGAALGALACAVVITSVWRRRSGPGE